MFSTTHHTYVTLNCIVLFTGRCHWCIVLHSAANSMWLKLPNVMHSLTKMPNSQRYCLQYSMLSN